jgi:hypothetical protein
MPSSLLAFFVSRDPGYYHGGSQWFTVRLDLCLFTDGKRADGCWLLARLKHLKVVMGFHDHFADKCCEAKDERLGLGPEERGSNACDINRAVCL